MTKVASVDGLARMKEAISMTESAETSALDHCVVTNRLDTDMEPFGKSLWEQLKSEMGFVAASSDLVTIQAVS